MSDILFLSVKEFAGKLRSDEGFISAIGDLATLTANTGKDMYLARAKTVFYINVTTGASGIATVELSVNGTEIETATMNVSGFLATANGPAVINYEFKNIGHKVAAGEIIKLAVTVTDTQVDHEGFIECFEEDTGQSPWQPTEFPSS